METQNNSIQNEPGKDNSVPAPIDSRIGKIGAAVGILGSIVYFGSLAIIFAMSFAMTKAGTGRLGLSSPAVIILTVISYVGLFLNIVGGILGIVSLTRKENKTFGIISIIICVLMLCACSVLNTIGYFLVPSP